MFRRLLGCLPVLMVSLCLSTTVEAATLILTSGQEIQGRIIEKNDIYVTLNSFGTTETYYLGEIASIDGQKIEIQAPLRVEPAPVEEKQDTTALNHNDEGDSLKRFMDNRHTKASSSNGSVNQKISSLPVANHSIAPKPPTTATSPSHPLFPEETEKSQALVLAMYDLISKMGSVNKPVVITAPDGGIIVITAQKITKYDKDLKLITSKDLP